MLAAADLRIHSLRTTFMKSSTFRFMDAVLTFRCCSMLSPVKKVKIISASIADFMAGFSASTFLAITSLRKARPLFNDFPGSTWEYGELVHRID